MKYLIFITIITLVFFFSKEEEEREEHLVIDVSWHQGEIDWKKVKEAGVEGVIIHCGYGLNYKSQDDIYFIKNVEGCIQNNIPFGVYIYSYADSVQKAESEAKHVIRLVSPYKDKLSLPIYYDLEYENDKTGISLGKYAVENGKKFIEILENNGYEVGIYTFQKWIDNYIKDSFNSYPLWIARYGKNDGKKYKEPVIPNTKADMWQYTSNGTIDGIKTNVDMSVCYKKIITEAYYDSLNISGSEKIVPLSVNCERDGEDVKFLKKNYDFGIIYAFNIYNIKSNLCRKLTLEMVEEMIENYGYGYDPDLLFRIYNIECDVIISLEIEYETETTTKKANAKCYGRCIEASIPRLTCFFQGDDMNTEKIISSKDLQGYASKSECIFGNYDNLEPLIEEEKNNFNDYIYIENEQKEANSNDVNLNEKSLFFSNNNSILLYLFMLILLVY